MSGLTAEDREALVDAAMRAVLDPGAFIKRGTDHDGNPYGEPLNDWQRRALRAAFEQEEAVAAARPSKRCGCAWCCANTPPELRGQTHKETCQPRPEQEDQS